jgi:hypothetical protein
LFLFCLPRLANYSTLNMKEIFSKRWLTFCVLCRPVMNPRIIVFVSGSYRALQILSLLSGFQNLRCRYSVIEPYCQRSVALCCTKHYSLLRLLVTGNVPISFSLFTLMMVENTDLRNVGSHKSHTASYPRRRNSSFRVC